MKVKFEKVIDGLNSYIAKEIYPNLNEIQEFAARLVVGRINNSSEALKAYITGNGFIKTLGLVDSEGMVEIDQLLHDVKREVERKGTIQIAVPLIGKLTFNPSDVDSIYDEIVRG